MTKTPTLLVSADLLDLKAAPSLPGLSLGTPERGETTPATCPHSGDGIHLDKPRIGVGSGADLSTVPRPVETPEARVQALVASAFPDREARAPSGRCERSGGHRAPSPFRTHGWREER
jgi:hypothetical protein